MQKTKIDWADYTFNPVTGCKHCCPYCYARKIAKRFGSRMFDDGNIHEMERPLYVVEPNNINVNCYPYGFSPTFHRYRLDEPQSVKNQQNIFVCSMADLFGEWVPDEWIKQVFEACEKAPQHRYLFLTKNIDGYKRLFGQKIPANFWLGYSATKYDVAMKYKHFGYWKSQMFLSAEPLLEPFKNFNASLFDWVIIGAETGNRKGKVIPERAWIEDIVNECRKNNIPVFLKNSLAPIWGEPLIQEYPWE
jgi:protein gp37